MVSLRPRFAPCTAGVVAALVAVAAAAGAAWFVSSATPAAAQQQQRLDLRRADRLYLRDCERSDALCAAERLIEYLARTGRGRVRGRALVRDMYQRCNSLDNAVCAARYIRRAIDQAQAGPGFDGPVVGDRPPRRDPRQLPRSRTSEFKISAAACNDGQCRLDQTTANHLCRLRGYSYAVSFRPYPRKWNLRECSWTRHNWRCNNNCRACGNGIQFVECTR